MTSVVPGAAVPLLVVTFAFGVQYAQETRVHT